MNVRRGGLGRGLGALIPTGPTETHGAMVGARFEEIPVEIIDPNPRQPRDVFDEDALAELVASIREVGVLQPVVVREIDGGRYQLIMGERRLRASKAAGLERVPAIVRETPDDAMLRDALLENLHRQQLNPLEEAAAYQQLLAEFGATHEELADRIGRSRSHVSNTLRLMNLAPAVQRRVAAGVLSAGHARALLALEDSTEQEGLAARIVAEGLSVRAVEEIVTAPTGATAIRTPPARGSTGAGDVDALAAAMGDRLETRVKIALGRRRGKITIEFADRHDLVRVVGALAPDLTGLAAGDPADGSVAPSEVPAASSENSVLVDDMTADDGAATHIESADASSGDGSVAVAEGDESPPQEVESEGTLDPDGPVADAEGDEHGHDEQSQEQSHDEQSPDAQRDGDAGSVPETAEVAGHEW